MRSVLSAYKCTACDILQVTYWAKIFYKTWAIDKTQEFRRKGTHMGDILLLFRRHRTRDISTTVPVRGNF